MQQKELDLVAQQLETKLRDFESQKANSYHHRLDVLQEQAFIKDLDVKDELERQRLMADHKFNSQMAEIARKTMLEQQKLDELQKQILIEEERFQLQKLIDEQNQERALLNKIRRKQVEMAYAQHEVQHRQILTDIENEFPKHSRAGGVQAKIKVPAEQAGQIDRIIKDVSRVNDGKLP